MSLKDGKTFVTLSESAIDCSWAVHTAAKRSRASWLAAYIGEHMERRLGGGEGQGEYAETFRCNMSICEDLGRGRD